MKFRPILGWLAVSLLIATASCSLIGMIPGLPCAGITTQQIPGDPTTELQTDCDGNSWYRTPDSDSTYVCYNVDVDSLGAETVMLLPCPE